MTSGGGRLLCSTPLSTACGRSAAPGCRHFLVVLLWRVVARRAAADDIARAASPAAHPAVAPEKEQRREREGRKRREEGQPKFDSK